MIRAGDRITFESGVALVVTKGGDGTLFLDETDGGALLVGKRYTDPSTGVEVMVIKPGSGALAVDGTRMTQAQPKKTKSAD